LFVSSAIKQEDFRTVRNRDHDSANSQHLAAPQLFTG